MNNRILYTGILILGSFLAKAQSSLQNNGIVFVVGATDTLYINAAFTNATTATLTNNGMLYLRQQVTNNQASMAVGTGMLWLTGTSTQIFGGTQPFRTLNLTTNTAGVTLNSNLHVSGAHTFINGIITTSATPNYVIYEAGSSQTGNSDAAHVNGWVKKFGSTNFIFPVGTATYDRSVTLTNLSATGEFNVRHNITTPNTGSYTVPLAVINPNEYWTINRISGGTAQVTMNWNHPKIPVIQHWLTDYRAVYNNAGTWNNQGGNASGNPQTTGSITSNVMNVWGNFTIGSVSAEVLPVHFIVISGQAKTGYNLVQWKTNDEFNINRFEIERSIDANYFSKIGEQAPNNSTGAHTYDFKDAQPYSGAAWYRIRNIDNDGKSQYSGAIRIAPVATSHGLQVMNTLVNDRISISAAETDKGDYQYALINAAGQIIQQGKFVINGAGITTLMLQGQVTTGTYMLHLFNNKYRNVEKILVR